MFCVSAKAAKGRQRHTSEGSRQQAMAAVTAQPSTPQLQPNNSAAGLFCPPPYLSFFYSVFFRNIILLPLLSKFFVLASYAGFF